MAAHRYWRVLMHSNTVSGGPVDRFSVAELKGATSVGGANVFTGGTPLASSGTPSGAFDANTATFWNTAVAAVDGDWLGYDLGGSPADIVEITITARNDGFSYQTPTKFDVQYSDTSSAGPWTTLFSRVSTPTFGVGETRTFSTAKTPSERVSQSYVLVAQNFPSPEEKTSQLHTLIAGKADVTVRTAQAYVLVAIRTGAEERMLRAWTFTQDDHDFYVLQCGSETFIYDKLSEQWCQWASPDAPYWRGSDGCDWEGWNVCCDPQTGQIYKIDADNRLDYSNTPIVSQVFGGATFRFRNLVPCYMAEVALSQANPPSGIDATTVGIKLESFDTLTWTDHGTVQGQPSGNKLYARFYGMGLMQSPGVLFKITDSGYARRIDGLTIEVGPRGSDGQ